MSERVEIRSRSRFIVFLDRYVIANTVYTRVSGDKALDSLAQRTARGRGARAPERTSETFLPRLTSEPLCLRNAEKHPTVSTVTRVRSGSWLLFSVRRPSTARVVCTVPGTLYGLELDAACAVRPWARARAARPPVTCGRAPPPGAARRSRARPPAAPGSGAL